MYPINSNATITSSFIYLPIQSLTHCCYRRCTCCCHSLQVGGPAVGLDHLGPIVLNTDGSISRISNWQEYVSLSLVTLRRRLIN
jgi:hypothetical protein